MPRAEPTPFDQKRAEELWEGRGLQWSMKHLTPGEDSYVATVWDSMPGDTCWMDAFFSILQGRVSL